MNEVSFGEMDELVDGEAASVNVIDGKRFRTKESGFLMENRSSDMQEMLIPGGVSMQESKVGLRLDGFKGKNVARVDASGHASTSPRGVDEAERVVEELTVRNYNSGNLETGASNTKDKRHSPNSIWHAFFPDEMHNLQKEQIENQNDTVDHSRHDGKQPASSNTLLSPNGIRTKILSQSGFSQYFVKNTLKGKGVICSSPGPGPDRDSIRHIRGQSHPDVALNNFNSAPDSSKASLSTVQEGLSLREWLKAGQNRVDKSKSMYVFKQILDLVDSSHSRGEALQALRPSCFKLTPLNHVLYMGSPITGSKEFCNVEKSGDKKRALEHGHLLGASQSSKRRMHGNSFRRWPQFAVHSGFKDSGYGFNENIHTIDNAYTIQNISNSQHLYGTSQRVSNTDDDPLEEQWYASPEDSGERCSTLASNVYSLGVLLFEVHFVFHCGFFPSFF